MSGLVGSYMLGSCANGAERDKGTLIHAVSSWVALCGREPGRRSAGWALFPDQVKPLSAVTCERCANRLRVLTAARFHPPAAWVVDATGGRIGLERVSWKRNCAWLVQAGYLRPSPFGDFYLTDKGEAAVAQELRRP